MLLSCCMLMRVQEPFRVSLMHNTVAHQQKNVETILGVVNCNHRFFNV